MKTWLEGKKTYIAAVAGIVLALALLYLGFITTDAAVEIIVFCVVSCGFRSAFTGAVARRIAEIVAEAAAAKKNPPGVMKLPPAPPGTNPSKPANLVQPDKLPLPPLPPGGTTK